MAVRLYYNATDSRARASTEWHDNRISKSGLIKQYLSSLESLKKRGQ